MCGIMGEVTFGDATLSDEKTFEKGMASMIYRGPDAQKMWCNDGVDVRMGHLRLSILDLRDEGAQPMHYKTANGKYTIVFNGEVYNYLEIRSELLSLGYTFNTGTDTEVILAAYNAYGEACLDKFNGMFAFVIYHHDSDEFFMARDRLGIKPFYYYIDDEKFIFGSEVKALRPLLPKKCDINGDALEQFMRYGYSTGEHTVEKGIYRLLPGHKMTLTRKGAPQLHCHRWWHASRTPRVDESYNSELDARIELEKLLKSSLDLRLRADVPVGVFLSGGLDSSAVVAMLSEQLDSQIKTYSVRYDIDEYGEEYDESHYAQMVADQFNTDHHVYTMTANDFINYIPEFVRTMDEPVTEAAAISLHYVSELAKNDGVTVVLSGEGSDEILGGYELYQNMQKLESLRKLATPGGAKLASLLSGVLPAGNKIRKYTDLAAMPFEQRYRGISVYDRAYHQTLYRNDSVIKASSNAEAYPMHLMQESRGHSMLSRMLDFDTRSWLVDDLLIKADRMSMGSSLELRVPFLDYRIVEFAAGLPDSLKIKNGECKYLLKKIMEERLPNEIVYREKRGFPTPLARMFKGPLLPYIESSLLLSDAPVAQFFNMPEIQRLVFDHAAGKGDHHRIIWQLLVLNEWMTQYENGV